MKSYEDMLVIVLYIKIKHNFKCPFFFFFYLLHVCMMLEVGGDYWLVGFRLDKNSIKLYFFKKKLN